MSHLNSTRRKPRIDNIWYRYMITIRKHQVKDYVTKDELDNVYKKIAFKLGMHDITARFKHKVYEIDHTYHQLHSHCLIYTSRPIVYKRYSSMLGFRVFWRPIYDLQGAKDYLSKDAWNENEQNMILIENFFRGNYAW